MSQGLKITSVSSGDRFNVVLAEPTSPRMASDSSRSPPVASPKKHEAAASKRDRKRVSCPLGLPLESDKGGNKDDDDVELRKSKGTISSPTRLVISFSLKRSKFRIRYPVTPVWQCTGFGKISISRLRVPASWSQRRVHATLGVGIELFRTLWIDFVS